MCFGQAARKDGIYENFRVTNCAFEGTFIAANNKFIAVCVEVGGGGAFMVLPVNKTGRLDPNTPKVSGHREYVLDMQWNPYDDNMLATCSEDGTIKLWEFPDYGPLTNMDDSKALLALDYHEKRCVQISWHPVAKNVLLSVSQEPKVCIWNLDDGSADVEIDSHPDIIWNASWSMKGDKIVTSCKDKKLRIFDARTGDLLVEGNGHPGAKAQRVIFTFNDKYLFSTGFSKMSERQYACWDSKTIKELNTGEIDVANGCLIPYYDPDTQIVYVAAKGDSVIRYYELVDEDPYFHYLTTYQSSTPQRGLATILKRFCNPNITEVFRFYKLCSQKTGYVEPISFSVPRKSELFQEDIYPETVSGEPALEAGEWFEGKDAEPNRISMKQFYKGKAGGKSEGGGLKKGGLKGLKAKKDAKDAAKASAKAEPVKSSEPVKAEPKVTKEPEKVKPVETKVTKPSSPPASQSSGADAKLIKDLQNEVKTLKTSSTKMEAEIKALTTKLKDYDKLTADIKLLCDAVKKK